MGQSSKDVMNLVNQQQINTSEQAQESSKLLELLNRQSSKQVNQIKQMHQLNAASVLALLRS